jgi:MYXO-CTERM domain-containing protein
MLLAALVGVLTLASAVPAQAAFAVFKRKSGLAVQPREVQRLFVSYLNGIQTLAVEPHFTGSAADFGMIIPSPGIPDVTTDLVKEQIDSIERLVGAPAAEFASGNDLTAPQGKGVRDGVTVVARILSGNYDVKVVSATTVDSLIAWLDENDYSWHDNDRNVLNSYVTAGWFFCVVKVNLQDVDGSTTYTGPMPPLTLQFAANQITIPMRIAYTDDRHIDWTILTDTPRELLLPTGVTSQVALRLTPDDVAADPMLPKLVAAGDVVTRFSLGLGTADGPDDFYFGVGVEPGPSPTPDDPAAGCSVAVQADAAGGPAPGAALLALGLLAAGLVLRRRRS